jgi:hypothetical protein
MRCKLARSRKKVWKSAAARRLRELAGNIHSVETATRIVAERLLAGVPCPPTDLHQIFPQIDVSGCEARSEYSGSGALLPDGKFFKIIYSDHMPAGRIRWTVAHEMAHALFETTGRNAPRSGDELERLCDMIATELLLPWKHFVPRIRENVSLDNVLQLAHTFQTSVTSAAIRCAEVCGVSVFEMDGKHLRWGRGYVRTEYDIFSESSLAQIISTSLNSNSGCEEAHLSFENRIRLWAIEWRRIGSLDRRIYLLRMLN